MRLMSRDDLVVRLSVHPLGSRRGVVVISSSSLLLITTTHKTHLEARQNTSQDVFCVCALLADTSRRITDANPKDAAAARCGICLRESRFSRAGIRSVHLPLFIRRVTRGRALSRSRGGIEWLLLGTHGILYEDVLLAYCAGVFCTQM